MSEQTEIETIDDLKVKFENIKKSLTKKWADMGISAPPTDKDVWGQFRAMTSECREMALMAKIERLIALHINRLELIDEVLKSL